MASHSSAGTESRSSERPFFLAQLEKPDPRVDFKEGWISRQFRHERPPGFLMCKCCRPFGSRETELRIEPAEELDELGHQPGPAGLMAGAQPGTVVAVEVFVEEDVVAPVGIGLEFLRAAIDRSAGRARRAERSG